jgi:hypothetical protein
LALIPNIPPGGSHVWKKTDFPGNTPVEPVTFPVT